ncbi:hypothetical protein NLG97_g11033 [Lecanicillium saksenae]|uniref:Uncharacterized protein n=1 Tax=Lecanicillium saksenae TaxID=468837 RepID=A0ACC1QDB8_9HYPO|nr:hypothetical protein NLG97_g11033 [Lecanicillium saksenae]
MVGNRLHADYQVGDTVQLSPPRGEFVFDATKISPSAPVVLLSAGVGATPMLSILDSIRDTTPGAGSGGRPRDVTWAHGARSSDAVCYGRHVRQAAADADANLTAKVFLGSVAEGDVKGVDYDYTGRFDLGKLVADKVLPLERADAEYFICGPKDWMILVRDGLQANGVDTEKIHLELFATGGV